MAYAVLQQENCLFEPEIQPNLSKCLCRIHKENGKIFQFGWEVKFSDFPLPWYLGHSISSRNESIFPFSYKLKDSLLV